MGRAIRAESTPSRAKSALRATPNEGAPICSSQSATEAVQPPRRCRRSPPPGLPLSLRSGNTYRASGSILCSAMRVGCSGPGAPAWLGQVSRSSDRHSTVVLNVARRHRASRIKPGRQGRDSLRAWPGGPCTVPDRKPAGVSREPCQGSVQMMNLRNCTW